MTYYSKTVLSATSLLFVCVAARNAIIVVIASGVSAGFLQHNHTPFTLTGHIKPGLPQFKAPSFTLSYENTTLSASEVFSVMCNSF